MDYFLILNKPIQCSICTASKHPHTTPRVSWGWPLTFSCSIRGKDGRGRGKWRYPFSLLCSVRKWHGLTRNESHLWHLVPRGSIHMHLRNTTSTQTSGVWRKSKCQMHTCFLKLLEAMAASCVSSVFTILATGRMSKSLIQTSTKCQRSQWGRIKIWIAGSLSELIHSYWLQKSVYLPWWNTNIIHEFFGLFLKHPLLNSPAFFKMTRSVHPLHQCVYPSPSTSFQGFGLKVDEFFLPGLDRIGLVAAWQGEDKARYLFLTNMQLPSVLLMTGQEEDKGKHERASALAQLADDAQLNYRKTCKWVENISCKNTCCNLNIKCVNAIMSGVCIFFPYLPFFSVFLFLFYCSNDKSNPFCVKAFITLSQYFWAADVPKLELERQTKVKIWMLYLIIAIMKIHSLGLYCLPWTYI